jgi:hypothetical protein
MQTQILIGLFIYHFLADYTALSTNWMLGAKKLGRPLLPIFAHALVHSVLMSTFLEVYFYFKLENYNLFEFSISIVDKLYGFQLVTHFLIDVWKGRMNGWFPELQSPANKWHWVVFGYDQLLHAIVIIIMSYYAVS